MVCPRNLGTAGTPLSLRGQQSSVRADVCGGGGGGGGGEGSWYELCIGGGEKRVTFVFN